MDSMITRHAARRMRGRAIPEAAVELLFRWGASRMQGGAELLFFDHPARRRLADAVGPAGVRQVEKWLDAYLVLNGSGGVVTAGWRTKRLRR